MALGVIKTLLLYSIANDNYCQKINTILTYKAEFNILPIIFWINLST